MLAKKKASKKAAITASVSKASATGKKKLSTVAGAGKGSSADYFVHEKRKLTRADVIEDGVSGDSRSELIRSIGDNINTRLEEIDVHDDLDEDLFDDKKKALMEEARLAAGTQQRVVSAAMAQYVEHRKQQQQVAGKKKGAAASTWGGERSDGAMQLVRVGHNSNAVTAVATLGAELVFFGDKSGKVYMADLSPRQSSHDAVANAQLRNKKVMLEPPMNGKVVSIAVSDTRGSRPNTRDLFEKTTVDTSCTSYVAAGASDGSISIWETASGKHKGLLFMHRKPVTGLAFRSGTSSLYSVSEDSTLRVWSVPQMMSTDKLFGHEGKIYDIDTLKRETCATVGDDGTMRFWKVEAATQQGFSYLVQHRDAATSPSIAATASSTNTKAQDKNANCPIQLECVAMLNESIILTGAVDGSIVVFDTNRRKPVVVVPAAHGYDSLADGSGLEKVIVEEEEGSAAPSAAGRLPNPISAIATVPYADVAATASCDGVVRLWHVAGVGAGSIAAGKRTVLNADGKETSGGPALVLIAELPVKSLVTSLRFSPDGDALYVGCSKEGRLGRWIVHRASLNSVCVLPLTKRGEQLLAKVGNVEHVPAQLYSFLGGEDDAEQQEDDDEDEEAGRGVGSSANNADEEEEDSLQTAAVIAEEDEDDADETFFTVGADGQLVFSDPSTTKLLPGKQSEDNNSDVEVEDDIMKRHVAKMAAKKSGLEKGKKKKNKAPAAAAVAAGKKSSTSGDIKKKKVIKTKKSLKKKA